MRKNGYGNRFPSDLRTEVIGHSLHNFAFGTIFCTKEENSFIILIYCCYD